LATPLTSWFQGASEGKSVTCPPLVPLEVPLVVPLLLLLLLPLPLLEFVAVVPVLVPLLFVVLLLFPLLVPLLPVLCEPVTPVVEVVWPELPLELELVEPAVVPLHARPTNIKNSKALSAPKVIDRVSMVAPGRVGRRRL
jgi:hypothetical protein